MIALSSLGRANPIVIEESVRKIRESCVIAIGDSFAHVSCSVTYHKIRPIDGKLYMIVPVFASFSADPNFKEVHSAFRMHLECESEDADLRGIGSPQHIGILPPVEGKEEEALPKYQQIYFYFGFDPPAQNDFTVVATYQQPLIEGASYYLPFFEYGEVEGDPANFEVTFFPIDDSEVTLESTHKGR